MATIVKPFTFASGALIIASEHNSNFDTIYADYNGGITNANISATAAIVASKLSGVAASGANSDITAITGLTTPLGPAYGGTGIANNAASTITITGSFATTITVSGTTSVTLPTSGTLISTTVTTLSSLVSIGTITTGVWNGTIITSAYGGTGNGFTKFTGPATSEKTFTLPNVTSTILTSNDTVTVAQGGSGAATLTGILKGNGTSAFTAVTAPSGTIVGTTDTQTLTNKRVTERVVTAADDSTAVIDVDITDQYQLTAMANATTISTTGTPTAGQKLIIRLKDNATARGLTWDSVFRAVGVTLPTTTVISKTHYIGCIYNLTDTKFDVVAVVAQA